MKQEILDIVKTYGFEGVNFDYSYNEFCVKTMKLQDDNDVNIVLTKSTNRSDEYYLSVTYMLTLVRHTLTEKQILTNFKECLDDICNECIDKLTEAVAVIAEFNMIGM